MNKLNNFKDSSCEKNDCQKDNQINHENNRKPEKNKEKLKKSY